MSRKELFGKFGIIFAISIGMTSFVSAQSLGGTSFSPSGINGSIGFGVAEFVVSEPATNFKLDQGTYITVNGERGLESIPIFVTFSLNVVQSTGQTNYNYTTLAGTTYSDTDIGFSTQEFQVGLGGKLKVFNSGWFRPYVELGGLFGYNEITYDISATIRSQGSSFKSKDGLTSTGYYGEAGIEVSFSEDFGLKFSYREGNMTTRPFPTQNDQSLIYQTNIFQLGLLKSF